MCTASVLTETILVLSEETVFLTMPGNSTINEFAVYFTYNVEECDAHIVVRVGTRTLGFV